MSSPRTGVGLSRAQIRQGYTSLSQIQSELSKRILDMTDNGDEVVNFFVGIMRDKAIQAKMRITAATWLANRMWGKEPEVIHLNTHGIFESLVQASDEELTAITRGAFSSGSVLPLLNLVQQHPESEDACDEDM
jgi:hypothetical protein